MEEGNTGRVIKFRAWDGESMYRVDSAMWSEQEGMHCLFIHEGSLVHQIDNNTATRDALVIMQSTGLKDKNGKEIYEGDIIGYVSYLGTQDVGDGYGQDEFDGAKMVIDWDVEKARFKTPFSDTENIPVQLIPTSFEVIGNIYENPDLLK